MDDEPAQSDVADTDHPLTITPSGLKCCFESYDTDGDGHITQDEFQAALILKLDAKDDVDVASHIRREVPEIFKELDTNNDGSIDFQEFEQGYERVYEIVHDKWRHRANNVKDLGEALPGGGLVHQATEWGRRMGKMISIGRSGSDASGDDDDKKATETDELIVKVAERQGDDSGSMWLYLFLMIVAYMLLLGLVYLIPGIFLFLGWFTAQSCDEPLDQFCRVQSIFIILTIVLSGTALAAKVFARAYQTCVQCLELLFYTAQFVNYVITIGSFGYLIAGAIWFHRTGGLFGESQGNCQTMAPELWEHCEMYFWTLLVGICLLGCCFISICCFDCYVHSGDQ